MKTDSRSKNALAVDGPVCGRLLVVPPTAHDRSVVVINEVHESTASYYQVAYQLSVIDEFIFASCVGIGNVTRVKPRGSE